MYFTEALEKLEAGVAMRRAAWPDSEGYLKVMPGMGYVWKIVLHPSPNAGNFIFSLADFKGDDWVEFTLPVEEVEAAAEAAEAA